jgi:hypothetical protein
MKGEDQQEQDDRDDGTEARDQFVPDAQIVKHACSMCQENVVNVTLLCGRTHGRVR